MRRIWRLFLRHSNVGVAAGRQLKQKKIAEAKAFCHVKRHFFSYFFRFRATLSLRFLFLLLPLLPLLLLLLLLLPEIAAIDMLASNAPTHSHASTLATPTSGSQHRRHFGNLFRLRLGTCYGLSFSPGPPPAPPTPPPAAARFA